MKRFNDKNSKYCYSFIFDFTSFFIILLSLVALIKPIFFSFSSFLKGFFHIFTSDELVENFLREHIYGRGLNIAIALLAILCMAGIIASGILLVKEKDYRKILRYYVLRTVSFLLIAFLMIPSGSLISDSLGNMNRYTKHLTIIENQIITVSTEDLLSKDSIYLRDEGKPLVGPQIINKEIKGKPMITHSKIYEDILQASISSRTMEERKKFNKDLAILIENRELADKVRKDYLGKKLKFKDKLITRYEFIELLGETFYQDPEDENQDNNKSLWIRCYEPENLLQGDIIKIYDSKEDFLKDESIPCSPEAG